MAVVEELEGPVLQHVESRILLVRGQKVILDVDLAALYGVEVRVLNQAVTRNAERFPADFMFQLADAEVDSLRSQFVISNGRETAKSGRGGRRYLPYAFTEQGVAMLSSVLRSRRAILVNVEIMRAFVHLRHLLASNAELARKLDELERRYDEQFRVVFDAIRALMTPSNPSERRPIGFRPPEEE
jgi:hypothetical protein